MCFRLLIVCGLLLTAGSVSAQHTCGPGCGAADDGNHTANRFEDRFANPPNLYGWATVPYDGYGPDRRRQNAQRMIQDPSGEFGQPPFDRQSPSQSPNQHEPGQSHAAHRHSHGGHACSHQHAHADHPSARSRQRIGARGYDRQAPSRNRTTPPSLVPNPNDLQPMSPPSLPPQSLSARSFSEPSRTARKYAPLPRSTRPKSTFKPKVSVTWLD